MKGLIYTSGSIINTKKTGGVKRFIELSKYLCNELSYDLCCSDSEEELFQYNLTPKFYLKPPKPNYLYKIIPELKILFDNRITIKRIKKEKYNNIIVFDVPPAIGLCLFNIKNITLMIRKDLIGYEIIKNKNNIFFKYLKILIQWISESICIIKVKKIIVQCNYDKQVLIKRHLFLKNTINKKTLIQINNINPSWIVEKSKENIGNNILYPETKTKKIRICFIGNFDDDRKGHNIFLKSAVKIINLKEYSNVEFIVIGGGKKLEFCKNEYLSYNEIMFMGMQNNPISILKTSSLLVVPSLADSCPNTILEALYNEIPVIGSFSGGIPEILNNQICLFNNNSDELADKILTLISNDSYMNNLIKYEKNRANELRFDWAKRMRFLIEGEKDEK